MGFFQPAVSKTETLPPLWVFTWNVILIVEKKHSFLKRKVDFMKNRSFRKALSLALISAVLALTSCDGVGTQTNPPVQKTDYDAVVAGWEISNSVDLTHTLGFGGEEYENYFAESFYELRDVCVSYDSKGQKYLLFKRPCADGAIFELYRETGEGFEKLGTGELGFYGGNMLHYDPRKTELVNGAVKLHFELLDVFYRSEMALVFGEDDIPYVVGYLDGKMVAYRVSGGAAAVCASMELPLGIGRDSGCETDISADGAKAFFVLGSEVSKYTDASDEFGRLIYPDNPVMCVTAFDTKSEKFVMMTKTDFTEYAAMSYMISYDDEKDTLYILCNENNVNVENASEGVSKLTLFKAEKVFSHGAEIKYEADIEEIHDPFDDGKSKSVALSRDNGYSNGIWAENGKVYIIYKTIGLGGDTGETVGDVILATYENGNVSKKGVSFADNFSPYAKPAFDDFFFLGGEVYYAEGYNCGANLSERCKFVNICKLDVETGETYVVKKAELSETCEPYRIEIVQNGESGLCVVYLTENKEAFCCFELG